MELTGNSGRAPEMLPAFLRIFIFSSVSAAKCKLFASECRPIFQAEIDRLPDSTHRASRAVIPNDYTGHQKHKIP
jgi:hypothetical protein